MIVGLLTESSEILNDIKANFPDLVINIYKNIEQVKRDGYTALIVDSDLFETAGSVQFLLSKIRKKIQEIPVLLIIRVNRLEEMDMNWFIDDFILYPFRKLELITRLKVLQWEKGIDDELISIGSIKINFKEYSVYIKNQKLELTYKEFELLRLLVQNRGTVYSRKDLLIKIWGIEYIGGTRTVDVHIRRLRGKLGSEFNEIIETVRNVGYKCKE